MRRCYRRACPTGYEPPAALSSRRSRASKGFQSGGGLGGFGPGGGLLLSETEGRIASLQADAALVATHKLTLSA